MNFIFHDFKVFFLLRYEFAESNYEFERFDMGIKFEVRIEGYSQYTITWSPF